MFSQLSAEKKAELLQLSIVAGATGGLILCQKKHLKLTGAKKTDIRSPSPSPLIPLSNNLPDPPTVRSPSPDELPSLAQHFYGMPPDPYPSSNQPQANQSTTVRSPSLDELPLLTQLLYGMPPDPSPPNPPQPIPSAPTLSQTSQRPTCQRKLPPCFEDYDLSFKSTYLSQVIAESQPSQPLHHRSLDPSPKPSPSLPLQELGTPINRWCTPQHGLGIYQIYHFRLPSQDPDEDLTIDNLVASNTFAELAGDAREGHEMNCSTLEPLHPTSGVLRLTWQAKQ
ncbi:hypothetical protein E1B28_010665 [Marasmius oreades]|uniref:Uncharacterized protein n=1 Tax=Marasmius oreades TaxID=181124 RepID=A0A9P7RXI7_9AGAR|nr:uncharacterized protein E1B28_010665 [Marasmius oreades]KAG7091644.1 hypothetical protein E1B28_010665 [Marasmius oreades]